MASNALADAVANVAIDTRAARKRRADDDRDVPLGRDDVQRAKRQRTVAPVKTEMLDEILVRDIDAPAAGCDDPPATRTSTTTRAMAAEIPATPSTAGCEWSATPLDFDAPAIGLPLEDVAFANFDWRPTATAPPQSVTTPLEHVFLYAKCNARADPLEANDGATVDPVLVAAHEDNRPRMPYDEKTQFTPQWNALLHCKLSAPGIDGPVLCPYSTAADADADIARLYAQVPKDEDCMLRVLLGDWEVPMSAPVDLGGLAPPLPADDAANIDPALWDDDRKPRLLYPPLQPRVFADDADNIDPALWDEDSKPLAQSAATDAPLDFQATNTHTPHFDNVAQLLAPAHADAPEDGRTPYVPFHEKLDYITEWRRRVETDAPAPAPIELPASLELPAPVATIPGAYYRADGVGIPVGDPRTRDWVPLPPYDATPDELARYGMLPMSPKTMQAWDEFVAELASDAYADTEPSAFREDFEPAGSQRARVEMGLLTPEEEAGPAVDPALLAALLLDAQAQR